MRKPQVSTIVIGLIAGVAVAALAIGIATAISARNSASGLKHLTVNVCKESSLTARNVEAGLLVLNGAAEISARDGTNSAALRAYWRANLPALRVALHERKADNAARQKLSDCLRVRDGIIVKLPRGHRHTGETSGQTVGKMTTKTTTNTTPFSGRQNTAGIPPASSEHAPNMPAATPRPGPTGHRGPAGAPGAPGPASSGNVGNIPAPAPQPPPPVPGLPSIPIPCVPIVHPC